MESFFRRMSSIVRKNSNKSVESDENEREEHFRYLQERRRSAPDIHRRGVPLERIVLDSGQKDCPLEKLISQSMINQSSTGILARKQYHLTGKSRAFRSRFFCPVTPLKRRICLSRLTAWFSLSTHQKCQTRLNGSRARRLSEKPSESRKRILIIKCHLLTMILIENCSSFRNSWKLPRLTLCFPSPHGSSSWISPVGIRYNANRSINTGSSNISFCHVTLDG